jgi:hypothetical protein
VAETKKSEMVQEAAAMVRGVEGRVCYCTPSREMVRSIQRVVAQHAVPNAQHVVDEMSDSVAEQLRNATGRIKEHESLRQFDTEDTDAAYALTNQIVRDAYAKTAAMYQEQGD